MLRLLGIIIMVGGLLSVVVGIIVGQMPPYVPYNILGLFSPVTAIAFYGGAVASFVGFAIAVINGPQKSM